MIYTFNTNELTSIRYVNVQDIYGAPLSFLSLTLIDLAALGLIMKYAR